VVGVPGSGSGRVEVVGEGVVGERVVGVWWACRVAVAGGWK
jgi:hypothetical protein